MTRTQRLARRLHATGRHARPVVRDLAAARDARQLAAVATSPGDARLNRRDAAGLLDRAMRETVRLLAAARGTRPVLWT
jgi:hypothetical protein